MKKHFILIILTICLGAELAVLLLFALRGVSARQDAVEINEALHAIHR